VGSLDDNLYALNAATGARVWSYTTSYRVISSPAVANGIVYVGSDDNNLYALNATAGVLAWKYTTGFHVYSSPAVANGVVYVGSEDDSVYAFGTWRIVTSVEGKIAIVESNATITSAVVTNNALSFTASGPTPLAHTGWVNITFPMVNSTQIRVFVNGRLLTPPPFPIITTNGTHYFIYFEFTLSTHEIAIQFGPVPDVAVTNVVSSKTVVGRGLSMSIDVAVANYGSYAEAFTVTAYANATSIALQNVTLSSGSSTAITFLWNTTGFAKGRYIISAYAWPVPGEIDTADNRYVASLPVYVAMVGDITGPKGVPDGRVDMYDVALFAAAFGSKPGDRRWNPNCDLTGPKGVPDGHVKMDDIALVAGMFGKRDP
jgi:hypothetical protein